MLNYKVCLKKGNEFLYHGGVEYALQDFYTTIQGDENANLRAVKINGGLNIAKQLSKFYFGNFRHWKHFYIDLSDLVIEY